MRSRNGQKAQEELSENVFATFDQKRLTAMPSLLRERERRGYGMATLAACMCVHVNGNHTHTHAAACAKNIMEMKENKLIAKNLRKFSHSMTLTMALGSSRLTSCGLLFFSASVENVTSYVLLEKGR